MNPPWRIRRAEPADDAAIRRVIEAAFGRADEAALVERLRRDGDALVELVALAPDGDELVGCILFSPLEIPGAGLRAAALAPLAVAPARQRAGVGSALTRAGLDACRQAGVAAVVVLGHPAYYPRFGFSAAAAEVLAAPFSGPAFMALELAPGALRGGGAVRYARAFGLEG